MKKIGFRFISLVLAVFLLGFIPVFAQDKKDLDDFFLLDFSEAKEFNANIASDEEYIDWVVTAATKKGRNVSLEGVHPDKIIKVYGIKNSDEPIKSICDAYEKDGKIKSMISDDYALLVLYVNENNEYVDSNLFIKNEKIDDAKDKNGWMPISSGNFVLDDGFLAEYSKNPTLKNNIDYNSLEGIDEFKFISSIPHFPPCFYFEKNNEEFLLPLIDGAAEIKSFSVYKVCDITEMLLKPIYEFKLKKYKENDLEINDLDKILGGPRIPDDLPLQKPVDLSTYFDNTEKVALNNNNNNNLDINEEGNTSNEFSSNSKLLYIVPVAVILIAALILVHNNKAVK